MLTRPGYLLRMEEAALLVGSLALYWQMHFSWLLFAVLFLVPDLFMVGYLANPKVGAAMYNLAHFVVGPAIVFAAGYWLGRRGLMAVGIIWFSHIAMDRMLGFGLKYPGAFKDTHLQHVG
ncbi:MAG: DUF4260 domain-containing protein [Acidobacteriaceae bacterium]